MGLLEDIATFLEAKITTGTYGAQGLVGGVTLFLGRAPAEAQNAVVELALYDGEPPKFTMGPNVSAVELPRLQVQVRGEVEDYPGARAWAVIIRNILAGWQVPDPTYFPYVMRIEPNGIPNPMGYDAINRPRFTLNFEIETNSDSEGVPTI